MLEKQKEWCQNNLEKGKKWFKENKMAIGFGLGAASMAGMYLLLEKINEPKSGYISYMRRLEEEKPDISAMVFYENRLGKLKQMVNIKYDYADPELKELCDNLNRVVYPGD